MTFIVGFLQNLNVVNVLERIILGVCFFSWYLQITSDLVYLYVACGVHRGCMNRRGGGRSLVWRQIFRSLGEWLR